MTNPDRSELVKLLVWGKSRITGEVGVMAQDAYTSIGHYIASDNGWFLQGQSGWNASASMDAAKAAAQADYEARIRSALVEVPAVKGEPEPVAWPSDGSCVRCGAIPRTSSGLCNTCLDEDAERYENAPPADAGMREALEVARTFVAGVYDSSPKVRIARDKALATIDAALTTPGATTKSDGGARSLTADETRLVEQALRDSGELVEPLLGPSDSPFTYTIAHDGFIGTIQGHYVTREGKEGVVLQQVGTRVVHVYGRKWIDADLPSDPSSTRSEVTVGELDKFIYEKMPRNYLSLARALLDQFEIRRGP